MTDRSSEETTPSLRLEYVSLTDACYARLKELILGRVLEWGEKLDVQALAQEFGVSRAPVIKAIERLAFEGLIDISPNRGSFVRQQTREGVLEAAEARVAFELAALELAFQKDPVTLIKELELNEQAVQKYFNRQARISEDLFLKYDTAFHTIIAACSKNATLIKLSEILRNQIELFRRQSYANDMATHSIRKHRAVIEALHKGDIATATAALRTHIEEVAQDYISTIDVTA